MTAITTNLFKITFLIINLLFLYKYGVRQEYISIEILLGAYFTIITIILRENIFKLLRVEELILKKIYIFFCCLIALIIFVIVFFTDGNSLNVDRWSAMDVALKALLNGQYPYTAVDHMNGRTSNFPGLLLIGLPFYLLGNVGYLGVFTFALLAYTLYKNLKIENAFQYILLLLISPAYWWEVFVISDLMNNIIIVMCFVILIRNKTEDIFNKPIFLGWSTALLVLTRGIVAIPLVVLVFKDFCISILKNKTKYVIAFVLTFILLCLMVLISCPDIETLRYYNPLVLQTHYLPGYIQILSIILPFIFSFAVKNFQRHYFTIASILIGFPTLVSFLFNAIKFNFNEMIYDSLYDISYLSIIIPFILIEIVKTKNVTSEILS